MVSFTEAQVLAWITPWLWAFFRVAGIFTTAPVLSQRSVPRRVRLSLAILIVICAQPSLPPMPDIAINSPQAVMVALPFKLMLFVLADGWNLLLGSLAASFVQ